MTATLDPFAPLMLSIVTVSPVAVSDGDVSAVASGRGEVQLANAKASVAAKATSRAGRMMINLATRLRVTLAETALRD